MVVQERNRFEKKSAYPVVLKSSDKVAIDNGTHTTISAQ